jgi:hypothetical protein
MGSGGGERRTLGAGRHDPWTIWVACSLWCRGRGGRRRGRRHLGDRDRSVERSRAATHHLRGGGDARHLGWGHADRHARGAGGGAYGGRGHCLPGRPGFPAPPVRRDGCSRILRRGARQRSRRDDREPASLGEQLSREPARHRLGCGCRPHRIELVAVKRRFSVAATRREAARGAARPAPRKQQCRPLTRIGSSIAPLDLPGQRC